MLVQEDYALTLRVWGALNSGEIVEKLLVAKFDLRCGCEINFQVPTFLTTHSVPR